MFGDDETTGNGDSYGYNAADDDLNQQLAENAATIEQKRQALTQQRLSIIKSQGGMQWEPGQVAAPVQQASSKSQIKNNNIYSAYASFNPSIDKLHTDNTNKLLYKMRLQRTGTPIL